MDSKELYQKLAYAGALPFIACAITSMTGFELPSALGTPASIAASYALAIASFLCGIHWATHFYKPESEPFNLLILSNILILIVWISFVIFGHITTLFVAAAIFAILLWIDHQIFIKKGISRDYLETRRYVTFIVVIALVFTGVSA